MILLANSPGGGAGAAGPETFLFCAWFGRQSRPNQAQNQMLLGGLCPPNLPSEEASSIFRLAIVRSPTLRLSSRFGELIADEHRGPYFRLFDERAAAQEWLSVG